LNLIEQALERIEEGPYRAKIPRNLKVNPGEYYSVTEGPRGMVGWYLVADGSMSPYRLKVRVPSFSNLQVVESLIPHSRVADVVAILGSVDVVIPEIDR
jgi:NADH-quinone oxidoreductase subunit D